LVGVDCESGAEKSSVGEPKLRLRLLSCSRLSSPTDGEESWKLYLYLPELSGERGELCCPALL
jgi:hypothetical protein